MEQNMLCNITFTQSCDVYISNAAFKTTDTLAPGAQLPQDILGL